MSRGGILAAALLAGLSLLAFGGASANPRMPPPRWKTPAGPPTEMGVWLRRLVGQYRIEGQVHVVPNGDCGYLPPPLKPPPCESVTGVVDCVGVGAGPGVQCILNVQWRDIYAVNSISLPGLVGDIPSSVSDWPGSVSYLNPAMVLFGLDPGKAAINYLLVDNKGLPEGGLGSSKGNRATFITACVNRPTPCKRTLRIEAKPDANLLYMWIDVEVGYQLQLVTSIILTLRRVPVTQDVAPPTAAPARQRR